jgi:hypothetical protein
MARGSTQHRKLDRTLNSEAFGCTFPVGRKLKTEIPAIMMTPRELPTLTRQGTKKMPGAQQVYSHIYDSRVLGVILPTCTPEEIAYLFGPVIRFATENEKPETLLELVRWETGMRSSVVRLAPSEPGEDNPAAPAPAEKTQPPTNLR